MPTAGVAEQRQEPGRVRSIAAWILAGFLALVFFAAGGVKLASRPGMIAEFQQVGLGQWFRYFTGILEVTGAAGVLIPRVSRRAALLLATVMAGAITAHLTVLHTAPTLPAVLLALALTLWWLRG